MIAIGFILGILFFWIISSVINAISSKIEQVEKQRKIEMTQTQAAVQTAQAVQKAEEERERQEFQKGIERCFSFFSDLYPSKAYVINFRNPCSEPNDLWRVHYYLGGTFSVERFLGESEDFADLYLVTINDPRWSINAKKELDIKQLNSQNYLVFGSEADFDIVCRNCPTPTPAPKPRCKQIDIDVPSARYNSPGCMAYRFLGGSSGLGGENFANPNYDSGCAYSTHHEVQTICDDQ